MVMIFLLLLTNDHDFDTLLMIYFMGTIGSVNTLKLQLNHVLPIPSKDLRFQMSTPAPLGAVTSYARRLWHLNDQPNVIIEWISTDLGRLHECILS
jgi:hypothetical protein